MNKIAVLRKYNFSVNDIKEMLTNNDKINEILEQHIRKTKSSAEETSVILKNLLNVSADNIDSADDLCEKLSSSDDSPPEICEVDYISRIKEFRQKLKKKLPLMIVAVIMAFIVTAAVFILTTLLFTHIFGNI